MASSTDTFESSTVRNSIEGLEYDEKDYGQTMAIFVAEISKQSKAGLTDADHLQ